MTMLIDTNRMLRFYNMNQTQAPNPGMSEMRAYFFNAVFEESAFVSVGGAGDIRGFKWWTAACNPYTIGTPCPSGSSTVEGWMTVIKDVNGNPLVIGLMPDDDNSLTIVKGSNKSAEGLKSKAFEKLESNYNLTYSLGSAGIGKLLDVTMAALNFVHILHPEVIVKATDCVNQSLNGHLDPEPCVIKPNCRC